MKRIFLLFCALALILSLAACAKAEAPAAEAASPTPAWAKLAGSYTAFRRPPK